MYVILTMVCGQTAIAGVCLPLCMIDWSVYIVQADTSVLNLPVEKMDYYAPGWATHDDNYDGEWRLLMALLPVQMTVEMISDFISSRILAGAICKYTVLFYFPFWVACMKLYE